LKTIVAINGSPHKSGNTATLLKEILNECASLGAKTEIIHAQTVVQSAKTPFCVACSSPCNQSCYIGTPLEEALNKLSSSDGVVLGSPVYFGTASAQIKAFFDKTRHIRAKGSLIDKKCGAISSGASRFGGQETTLKALHDIALVQGMSVIGDGYEGFDAGHHGVCGHGSTQNDESLKQRAKILAARLMK